MYIEIMLGTAPVPNNYFFSLYSYNYIKIKYLNYYIMKKNSIFIKLLKKHTDIDIQFIDTFFKKFKVGGELEFNIKENDITKYLGISTRTLRNRLSNTYSKNELYFENVDYIKVKSVYSNKIIYMLNYPCFEKIAMGSDSPKSEIIKIYFIKLRQFITNNHELIYQALENKDELDIYSGYESLREKNIKYFFPLINTLLKKSTDFFNNESIYFIAIDERKPNILKVGRMGKIEKSKIFQFCPYYSKKIKDFL